jgi:hypothetical protein
MGVLDSLRAHVLACAVIDLTAWLFDHFQLERCSALRFVLSTVPIQVVSSGPKTLQDDDLRQNADRTNKGGSPGRSFSLRARDEFLLVSS